MENHKEITFKITKNDALYRLFYFENYEDDDPSNDKFTEIIFKGGAKNDVAVLKLRKFMVHMFSFMAMGRAGTDIIIEIPEISFKKPYTFGADRRVSETLSLPIY